ncbi:Glycoside hydrolase family 5 protein [Venustampulla echinocandica]|uniref:Glycoside hydrolase family 5 protein n=1 Tax=Venustampulla echinocandica TaxID=2656787 RepID=A0A370THY6_9HELO|nr:Glycoside hydrolase family 5 protein [Venustampulla echinocandica]RDL34968.1 Glycoside hydrolase family 5 protein [Venustampulla echinocandica]
MTRFSIRRFLLLSLAVSIFLFVLGQAYKYYRFQFSPDKAAVEFLSAELAPVFLTEKTKAALAENLPLRTRGRDVIDAMGQRFKLASINWYGASDETFISGGLDIQHRSEIAEVIRDLGFNSVRLPYSDEMVNENPLIPSALLAANADLVGSRALDVYVAVVNSLTDAGLAVIVNDHISQARWCCGLNLCDTAWHNDYLGPFCRVKQTEDQWIQNWETIMAPYVNNSLVIGADLRNEVRGPWGTMPWGRWAAAAERAGNRLLRMNPDWLIIVEGVSSANDLSGVRTRPVVLDIDDRVLYSAHVYSWSGWGSLAGKYSTRPYTSFVKSMQENWAYLIEEEIAPVWVGEFGAPRRAGQETRHYWDNLLKYLQVIDADFAYWAINPRKPHKNTTETYSLVRDDWKTPVFDYRMKDMKQLMGI